VAEVLARASSQPYATAVLHVSPSLAPEVARNLELLTAPALEVAQLYTGVLYQGLDVASLGKEASRRARRWIVVMSALYGAVRLNDRVAPYRLSMGSPLPELAPLAPMWREHLNDPLAKAAGKGLVVDCRSAPYAAAWTPRADAVERWVQIRVPGVTHQSKQTRGLVTRDLCVRGIHAHTPHQLAAALSERFRVGQPQPPSRGRGWQLDVYPAT
jgi:cytoplasmic iron level regulating protein YaaA (DUF328/UPF0246 family)